MVPFLNAFARVSPQGGRQSILVDFIDFLTGSFGLLQDLIWEEAEITVRKSKKSKSKLVVDFMVSLKVMPIPLLSVDDG